MNFDIKEAKCALIRSGKTQVQLSEELFLSRPCVAASLIILPCESQRPWVFQWKV